MSRFHMAHDHVPFWEPTFEGAERCVVVNGGVEEALCRGLSAGFVWEGMAPSKLQKRRGGPPSIGGPANSGPTIRDFAEEIEAELSRDARSSALHAAARRGNKELAELALSEGGRINHLDSEGKTALLVAVEGKRKELAMWLLSKGADPFQQDAMGADCGSFVDIEMGISAAKEVGTVLAYLFLPLGLRLHPPLFHRDQHTTAKCAFRHPCHPALSSPLCDQSRGGIGGGGPPPVPAQSFICCFPVIPRC
jgi:hypothetical protein